MNNLYFVHIEKSAGTFIEKILKNTKYEIILNHQPLRMRRLKNLNYNFFTTIRDPIDFYKSLYYFFKLKHLTLKNRLKNLKNYNFYNFIQIMTNPIFFKKYIIINNIPHNLYNTMYSLSNDKNIGYYTFMFLNTLCKNNSIINNKNIENNIKNFPFFNVDIININNLNINLLKYFSTKNIHNKNTIYYRLKTFNKINTTNNISKIKIHSNIIKLIKEKDKIIYKLLQKI